MSGQLHVFVIGPDRVVARDADDARVVWSESTGLSWDDDYADAVQMDDDAVLVIVDEEQRRCGAVARIVGKTAAAWAAEGRGFLCSEEY